MALLITSLGRRLFPGTGLKNLMTFDSRIVQVLCGNERVCCVCGVQA